jgi:hypothetical protein
MIEKFASTARRYEVPFEVLAIPVQLNLNHGGVVLPIPTQRHSIFCRLFPPSRVGSGFDHLLFTYFFHPTLILSL